MSSDQTSQNLVKILKAKPELVVSLTQQLRCQTSDGYSMSTVINGQPYEGAINAAKSCLNRLSSVSYRLHPNLHYEYAFSVILQEFNKPPILKKLITFSRPTTLKGSSWELHGTGIETQLNECYDICEPLLKEWLQLKVIGNMTGNLITATDFCDQGIPSITRTVQYTQALEYKVAIAINEIMDFLQSTNNQL